VEIIFCLRLKVEPCLSPAIQVCSVVYHVNKVTELVGHSLIQCLFWLIIVAPCTVYFTFSTVHHFCMCNPVLMRRLCCMLDSLVVWYRTRYCWA